MNRIDSELEPASCKSGIGVESLQAVHAGGA